MKPLPHHYDVHLSSHASGYAMASNASAPSICTLGRLF